MNTCMQAQDSFSAYLDGTLNGIEMQGRCRRTWMTAQSVRSSFAATQNLQQTLAALGPVKMPNNLGLKLRLAISHENARRNKYWLDVVSARWDNVFRPFLVQYSAGLASAVLLIGTIIFLVSAVAAPQAVLANDEPLGALTAPHYLYSATTSQPVITPDDSVIVIQANVDAAGQVYDYKILSGPESPQVEAQVRNELMLQRFEPARAFGEPIRGQVLITFAGTVVRG